MKGSLFRNRWMAIGFAAAIVFAATFIVGEEGEEGLIADAGQSGERSLAAQPERQVAVIREDIDEGESEYDNTELDSFYSEEEEEEEVALDPEPSDPATGDAEPVAEIIDERSEPPVG